MRLFAPSQCAVSILNNVLIAEEARAKCLRAERDEGVLAQLLVLPALVGRATLRTQRSGMAGLAAQRSVLTLVAAKGKHWEHVSHALVRGVRLLAWLSK